MAQYDGLVGVNGSALPSHDSSVVVRISSLAGFPKDELAFIERLTASKRSALLDQHDEEVYETKRCGTER